jgi:hypothetical protein
LWVALILRRYIRELRQIDETYGPFPDHAYLSAFYNGKLDLDKSITYPDDCGNTIHFARPDTEPFDDPKLLVFTHGDLSMRNIILGRDGRI